MLAWAVLRGRRAGLLAACCVAAADLAEVRRLSASTLDAIVLLLIAGSLLGWAVELLRAGRADLARAVALQAATRERERLAADIHDSVLQVLAFVRRRGAQIGGEAATIASSPASRRCGCVRSWPRAPRSSPLTPRAPARRTSPPRSRGSPLPTSW